MTLPRRLRIFRLVTTFPAVGCCAIVSFAETRFTVPCRILCQWVAFCLCYQKKEIFVIVRGHKTRASKANKFSFPCMTTNDSRNSRQKVNLLKLTPLVFVQVLCFVLFCFCFFHNCQMFLFMFQARFLS